MYYLRFFKNKNSYLAESLGIAQGGGVAGDSCVHDRLRNIWLKVLHMRSLVAETTAKSRSLGLRA